MNCAVSMVRRKDEVHSLPGTLPAFEVSPATKTSVTTWRRVVK